MARSSRLLAVPAAALALTAPAYAANSDAPGQLKKDEAAVQVAPAPLAQAPAPQSAAPQGKATAPVTKGSVKRALKQTTTASPSTGGGGGSRHPTTGKAAHRSVTRAHTTATSTHAAVTRTHARSGSGAGSRSVSSRHAATPTAPPRPAARVRHSVVPRVRSALPQATTVDPVQAHSSDQAPLASITRAADRVVEVIPGALILALAGLTALVLVLTARSWVMERRRGKALVNSYGVTVEALATAIEAKDHCTGGHIERVRKLGLLLASRVVPREAKDPQMAYGFLLHDIGKLAVPDEILRAPGRLSAEQWALMRRHPEEGVRMLSGVPFLDKALDVVRHHHERWDGGGYPDGLSGEEIPLWARIFSVVDALDAITAARPYRAGRSYQEALEEIRRHAGTQFDPEVVAAFERIEPREIEPLLEPVQIVESPLAPVADLRELIPA